MGGMRGGMERGLVDIDDRLMTKERRAELKRRGKRHKYHKIPRRRQREAT